jgi:hypothetical protein
MIKTEHFAFVDLLSATLAFTMIDFLAHKLPNVTNNDKRGRNNQDGLSLNYNIPDVLGIVTIYKVINEACRKSEPAYRRNQVKHTYPGTRFNYIIISAGKPQEEADPTETFRESVDVQLQS